MALVAAVAAADSASYVVLNHGRVAGEMMVISWRDSVVVKYHHVDRQRGPRSETRYRVVNGNVLGGETWTLPLNGPEPLPRNQRGDRCDVVRDAASWAVRDSVHRAPFSAGTSFFTVASGHAIRAVAVGAASAQAAGQNVVASAVGHRSTRDRR